MNRRELFQLGLATMVGVKAEPLRGGARSGKTVSYQCVRCHKTIGWDEYCVNFENCSECLDADFCAFLTRAAESVR